MKLESCYAIGWILFYPLQEPAIRNWKVKLMKFNKEVHKNSFISMLRNGLQESYTDIFTSMQVLHHQCLHLNKLKNKTNNFPNTGMKHMDKE